MKILSPIDATMHAKVLNESQFWNVDTSICLAVTFPSGSCCITAYKLTPAGMNAYVTFVGLEWGANNPEPMNPEPAGYQAEFFEKVQIFLSDRFLGFFMVPENGVWNYNFMKTTFSPNIRYTLTLANPIDFFHESHRPAVFLNFGKGDDEADRDTPDKEDLFT